MKSREPPPVTPGLQLSGEYEYMTEGYYACQDAELSDLPNAMPTCADTLDAYVVPIALEKAAKHGLAVPDWVLTNEYFPVPAVCYGVNPFSRTYAVVRTEEERPAAAKRLTWNFKYTMCCQRMDPSADLVEFRVILGTTEDEEFAPWAEAVHRIFRLPLATVRLIRNGQLQLSAIEVLPWSRLSARERERARELARGVRG